METNKNNMYKNSMLTRVFGDADSTKDTYNTLLERGYSVEEINIIMSAESRKKRFTNAGNMISKNHVSKATLSGAAIGIVVGFVTAVVIVIASLELDIKTADIVIMILIGVCIGGIAGAIIGAFYGIKTFEKRIRTNHMGTNTTNLNKFANRVKEKSPDTKGRINGIELYS